MLWRGLLLLFYALVLVDGALRKWVVPGHASAVYLLKDVVLLCSFVLFCFSGTIRLPTMIKRGIVPALVLAYAGWTALEMLNPHVPNASVALLGLKSHALYLLLVLMVPVALPSDQRRSIRGVTIYILAAAIPISAVGVVQFFQPASSWINRYAAESTADAIATFGSSERARVTGTFSYITGMTTFVILNLGLAFGLLLAGIRVGGRLMYLGWLLLAVGLCVAPMTGSRAALYLPALAVPPILLASLRGGLINGRLLLAGCLCVLGVIAGSRSETAIAWGDFRNRIETTTDSEQRAADVLVGPLVKLDQAGVFGYGAGTTHQAAPSLAPGVEAYSWLPTALFEEETGRVALELGLFGLLVYLTLKLTCCVMAYRLLWNARTGLELTIGVTAFTFFVAHLTASVVFNAAAAATYWGLFGWVALLSSRQRASARLSDKEVRRSEWARSRRPLVDLEPEADALAR